MWVCGEEMGILFIVTCTPRLAWWFTVECYFGQGLWPLLNTQTDTPPAMRVLALMLLLLSLPSFPPLLIFIILPLLLLSFFLESSPMKRISDTKRSTASFICYTFTRQQLLYQFLLSTVSSFLCQQAPCTACCFTYTTKFDTNFRAWDCTCRHCINVQTWLLKSILHERSNNVSVL